MITVEIEEVCANITPPRLRSTELMEVVQTIGSAFAFTLEKLYEEAEIRRYETAFTGQVIYLEHLLNDLFDLDLRRIYITNNAIGQSVYLFNKVEGNEPVYLYNKSEIPPNAPLYLVNKTEFFYSFIIHVPNGIITNWDEFRAWVDKYKLKSKMYIIQIF
jgi:hypothetical protein